jgi:hypothetical protein
MRVVVVDEGMDSGVDEGMGKGVDEGMGEEGRASVEF